jgi:hypothetical protein
MNPCRSWIIPETEELDRPSPVPRYSSRSSREGVPPGLDLSCAEAAGGTNRKVRRDRVVRQDNRVFTPIAPA